uniref:Pentacotripeptide-repeat region of PRORP domain-containing protein n=1 Tax=Ditylum brightwellii TaxID=49249 RepID=A0A7S4S8Q9_9STRA
MEPNVVSFNGVIAAWSNSNTIESGERGERLLHQMVDIKSNNSNQMMIPPDIITYNSVLHAYATSSKCGSFDAANKALNLLHKMENEEFHIKPDVYSYATVMDAFAQRGTGGGSSSSGDGSILSGATSATIGVESAETVQYLLQKMKRSKTIHPNTVCYNAALLAWARSTYFDCAERCELLLREMEKQEGKRHYATAKPDRISYNTLLQAYANSPKSTSLAKAEHLLRRMSSMKSVFLHPDRKSYNTAIVALAKHASSPSFVPPDTIDSGNKKDKNNVNSSITERAEKLLDEMIHKSKEQQHHKRCSGGRHKPTLSPNTVTYNALINAYANSFGDCTIASCPTDAAKKAHIAVERVEGILDMMERSCCSSRNDDDLNGNDDDDVCPDATTYASVIHTWIKSGAEEAPFRAEELLNFVEFSSKEEKTGERRPPRRLKSNAVLYSAVLQAWAKTSTKKGAERAEVLLERQKKLYEGSSEQDRQNCLKPTAISYNALMDAWARSGVGGIETAEKVENILTEMERMYREDGDILVKPSKRSYNAAFLAWRNSGVDEAPRRSIMLLSRMFRQYKEEKNLDLKPDTPTINAVMNVWAASPIRGSAEKCEEFLHYMEKAYKAGDISLKPNRISFNTCINAWANRESNGLGGEDDDAIVAAERANRVLNRMERWYDETRDMDMKPDIISYRTAAKAWGASKVNGSKEKARSLMQRANYLLS